MTSAFENPIYLRDGSEVLMPPLVWAYPRFERNRKGEEVMMWVYRTEIVVETPDGFIEHRGPAEFEELFK